MHCPEGDVKNFSLMNFVKLQSGWRKNNITVLLTKIKLPIGQQAVIHYPVKTDQATLSERLPTRE